MKSAEAKPNENINYLYKDLVSNLKITIVNEIFNGNFYSD